MAPLGALSQAWVFAEASLPLGWRIVGLLRRERALRLLPAVRDEALILYDGWGGSHYQALNDLAIKLAKLRGAATGD